MRRVEYHSETVTDLNEAVDWYESIEPGSGSNFRAEIYAAVNRIREEPSRHVHVKRDVRQCLVRRFPYSVLFRPVGDDVVRILVIRHHRRRPELGLDRS